MKTFNTGNKWSCTHADYGIYCWPWSVRTGTAIEVLYMNYGSESHVTYSNWINYTITHRVRR